MGKLKFNALTPLYTSDAVAWRLDQIEDVLDRLTAAMKPIIVFVHGRGKEPNKSLKGGEFVAGLAVQKLERGYDVGVLMFNWDSAFPGIAFWNRSRPLSKVPDAAGQFSELLEGLRSYRNRHPTFVPPVLLAHSMGSFVIKSAVEQGLWPDGSGIFKHVVLSQPDVDDVGHAAWVDRLAAQEMVFSTMNRDDKVLHRSTDARPEGCHALGLDTDEPLAFKATYVDLTNMGPVGSEMDDDHEVFGKGAMNGQVYVCQFFEQALRGEKVVLDSATNVESIDRGVVLRLKAKYDTGAPCLQKV